LSSWLGSKIAVRNDEAEHHEDVKTNQNVVVFISSSRLPQIKTEKSLVFGALVNLSHVLHRKKLNSFTGVQHGKPKELQFFRSFCGNSCYLQLSKRCNCGGFFEKCIV